MRSKWMTGVVLAGTLCGPAISAELGTPAPQAYSPRYRLLPEQHVLEVVNFSGFGLRFLINGHYFYASAPACPGWVAGDHVRLVAGDWHGYCATAVFYDLTLRRSCQVACDPLGGPDYWH